MDNDNSAMYLDVNSRLVYACETGALVDAVRSLIDQGADVAFHDPLDGETALHKCAANNFSKLTALLLKANADPNAVDETGQTPLHVCASNGSNAVLRRLVGSGAMLDARTKDLATPLHYASAKGQLETARLLLNFGADPTVVTESKETAADFADPGDSDMQELLQEAVKSFSKEEPFDAQYTARSCRSCNAECSVM